MPDLALRYNVRLRTPRLDGNIASRRVSETLSYRVVGHGLVAPRGTRRGHTHFDGQTAERRSPLEVRIEGPAAALPRFLAAIGEEAR